MGHVNINRRGYYSKGDYLDVDAKAKFHSFLQLFVLDA